MTRQMQVWTKKVQDKSLNEDETEWKQDTDSQVQEAEMEIETGKTADAADADAILDAEMQTPDEGVESPRQRNPGNAEKS